MKRVIAWFARTHVAANLLMGLLILAGLASVLRMPQKTFPDIDTKVITIGVPYLGASPEQSEEAVCIRIEEQIDGIDGIERIRSTGAEGACAVTVELFDDADESAVLDEVKNRVDAIDTFPEETEKPVISTVTMKWPVMDLALTGSEDERTLKVFGQRVRDEIAALPGITQVVLSNTRPYEISIELSEESLRRHGLSFGQVANAVRQSSLDLPGGTIKTEGGEILLRTKGQAYWGPEFEKLVVLTRSDGTRVLLSDVATVVDGFEDTEQAVWFNGRPAAIIQVSRVGNQDVLEVAETLREYLRIAKTRLPPGVELTIWQDGSEMLRSRLDTLLGSARQGFLMVLLLLALFLRPRLSFWVSVGVPVSFLGALWLISALGLSIDSLTVFGFILVLGILVDDAIVVGENVHTHQQRHEEMLPAAISGTQEVAIPVIFGVLTTVAAFLPLLLGPGAMGQIQALIAIVVMACLFCSLVESQLVLPAHLGHTHHLSHAGEVALMLVPILALLLAELTWDLRSYVGAAVFSATTLFALHRLGTLGRLADAMLHAQGRFAGGLQRFTRRTFRSWVELALEWRYVTASIAIATLLVTLGVLGSGRLPFSFFPPLEGDNVTARITMPLGTPAAVTEAAVLHLERTAAELSAQLGVELADDGGSPILHVLSAVGGHPVSDANSSNPTNPTGRSSAGGHLGEVTLQLVRSEERDLTTRDIANRWRDLTGPIPDALEVMFATAMFAMGGAVDIQLQGRDVDQLREAAARLRERLGDYPGVMDIADSFRSGKQELKLSILPSGEALGLSLNNLARQVRQAFYGEQAQRIQRGRDDVRVMVRYTETERRSLGSLESMRIRTPAGSEVPFGTVAEANLGRGFSTIRRVDRQRVVNVTAEVDRTLITPNELMAKLRVEGLPEILRDYPGVSFSLEGEQREQTEAMASLIPLFAIALFLIYALLAIPLSSYLQPLIIMSVIPFALVGATIGHLIMSTVGMVNGLSFMSVMGFIAAAGVVVNSSLVLVHYVNARRAEGRTLLAAVRDAALARFRPILLTSLTTFAGLGPLMFNRSVEAQFMVPMAISLAWGVLFSALITLLVVPCGYLILEDLRALRRGGVELIPDSQEAA